MQRLASYGKLSSSKNRFRSAVNRNSPSLLQLGRTVRLDALDEHEVVIPRLNSAMRLTRENEVEFLLCGNSGHMRRGRDDVDTIEPPRYRVGLWIVARSKRVVSDNDG